MNDYGTASNAHQRALNEGAVFSTQTVVRKVVAPDPTTGWRKRVAGGSPGAEARGGFNKENERIHRVVRYIPGVVTVVRTCVPLAFASHRH